jgi:hypothetical protein
MNMARTKSPFVSLSLAEVNKAERSSYVLQIGNEFYNKDGNFIFTGSQAEKYYDTLLVNILYTIDNGTPKQVDAAMRCLSRLHIWPLRLH